MVQYTIHNTQYTIHNQILTASVKWNDYYSRSNAKIEVLNIRDVFAAKSKYSYIQMNGFVPEEKSLYISPIDKPFTVGMEYSF